MALNLPDPRDRDLIAAVVTRHRMAGIPQGAEFCDLAFCGRRLPKAGGRYCSGHAHRVWRTGRPGGPLRPKRR